MVKKLTSVSKVQKWQYKLFGDPQSKPLHNIDQPVKDEVSSDSPVQTLSLGADDGETPSLQAGDEEVAEKTLHLESVSTFEQDKFDRRWIMLNSSQMLFEHIPTPSDMNSSTLFLIH